MANYPREIYLDSDTEQRLRSWLDEELTRHYMERGPFLDDLLRWQKDYWAKPSKERATFPFTGASTIVIPLTAIAVEAIHARTMTTLFGLSQFVSAKPVGGDWTEFARPVEQYLDRDLLENAKAYRPLNDAILELEKFGTGVAKTGYEKIVRTAVRMIGETEQEFPVVVRDGACIDAVALSRFLMPFTDQDEQRAPWCGEEHSDTPYSVRLKEDSGLFRPKTMEKLEQWVNQTAQIAGSDTGHKFQEAQAELEHRNPTWPQVIDWVEIWCGFNVDASPDGKLKEIVVHYHRPSQTFMSIRYNWHEDLRRPYRKGVYFPVEHRWAGMGIAKQNEQFMREITTQHRQRLDNATLANMRMIKVSKLSGYGPKEPVFPGKIWFLDDMSHVETFQLGEIYNSAYNNEQATLLYSQQRTGVNEVTLGMPQVGTPGTATSDLARIQEGSKKYDFIYRNVKNFANELIVDYACNVQQFGPRNLTYFETQAGGKKVKTFFQMPESYIREGLILELRASGQQENRLIDRQNWQQITQFLQQYYTNMLQLAQQTGDAVMMQTIQKKAMTAATEAMKQILESFEVRNVDRILTLELDEQLRNGTQNVPSAAGNPGLAGIIQPPGMVGAA